MKHKWELKNPPKKTATSSGPPRFLLWWSCNTMQHYSFSYLTLNVRGKWQKIKHTPRKIIVGILFYQTVSWKPKQIKRILRIIINFPPCLAAGSYPFPNLSGIEWCQVNVSWASRKKKKLLLNSITRSIPFSFSIPQT